MTPNTNNSANGIARWACPWPAPLTSMQSGGRARHPHALLKNAHRRIQRISVAATCAAATVWLLAIVWVSQIIA